MENLHERIIKIIQLLQNEGIKSLLYGSAGASLYLGPFKTVNDIDLLIDSKLLNEDWSKLKEFMQKNGFFVFDKNEHEFIDGTGEKISFAEKDILIKDQICDSLHDVVNIQIENLTIATLSPTAFRKAYIFSSRDGYRQSKRELKDTQIIKLFDQYLASH